jgi:MFS family permease
VTEVLPGDDLFAVGDPSDPAEELAAGVIAEAGDGTTAGTRSPSTTFASLRHRNFLVFWVAAIISNSGSNMQAVTVPFVIYGITGSAAWLGISAACTFVPTVIVGPIAGAVADRYQRRKVLLITQTIQMLAAFALWGVWVTGHAGVASILTLVVLSSCAGGINIASWQAFVPSLVPREDLMNAVRLNSIQFTLSRAVGPALAGLVLSRFGAGASFMVNAVTYLLVIAALMSIPPHPNVAAASRRSVAREFVDGIRYMRRRPALMQCVLNALMMCAFSFSIVQLAPAIARDQLHIGKSGYGFLLATEGAASIISSFWLAVRGDSLRRSQAVFGGVCFAIAAGFVLSLATNFWIGATAFFCIGLGHSLTAISQNTTIQVQVSDEFRGRVLAVYLMSVQLGLPVGSVLLGTIADTTGTRTVAFLAGATLFVYLLYVSVRYRGYGLLDPDYEVPPTREL